jgi:hypothetical protein
MAKKGGLCYCIGDDRDLYTLVFGLEKCLQTRTVSLSSSRTFIFDDEEPEVLSPADTILLM